MSEILPWEHLSKKKAPKKPTMVVDLRRCIGCHACSVACKVEHEVPLGEFRLRVRWLPDPSKNTISFLPVFDTNLCDMGQKRSKLGLDPSCVTACPTKALTFGDAEGAPNLVHTLLNKSEVLQHEAVHSSARYIGLEKWHAGKLNKGAQLSPDDEDIIYEQ